MLPALAAADLVVGRAGSSTLAEVTRARACRWSSCRTRTPPATSGRTPRSLVDAGAARLVEDEAFDAAALLDAAVAPRRPDRATPTMSAAARVARPARRGRRRGGARPAAASGARCRSPTTVGIERRSQRDAPA